MNSPRRASRSRRSAGTSCLRPGLPGNDFMDAYTSRTSSGEYLDEIPAASVRAEISNLTAMATKVTKRNPHTCLPSLMYILSASRSFLAVSKQFSTEHLALNIL